jgi:hypothetical protein
MNLYLISVEAKFTSNPMELFNSVKSCQKLESDIKFIELNRELEKLHPKSISETQTSLKSKNLKVYETDCDRVKHSGFSVLWREFETWWILVDFSNPKMVPVKREIFISEIRN